MVQKPLHSARFVAIAVDQDNGAVAWGLPFGWEYGAADGDQPQGRELVQERRRGDQPRKTEKRRRGHGVLDHEPLQGQHLADKVASGGKQEVVRMGTRRVVEVVV